MDIRQFRVSVRAKNFDRTCHFYGEALALPSAGTWERNELRGALYQAGNGLIEVIGRAAGAEPAARDEVFDYQGPQHKMTVTLIVPSAEKAYEDGLFREKNIPGGLRHDEQGDLIFETHDPDGVKIIFRQAHDAAEPR